AGDYGSNSRVWVIGELGGQVLGLPHLKFLKIAGTGRRRCLGGLPNAMRSTRAKNRCPPRRAPRFGREEKSGAARTVHEMVLDSHALCGVQRPGTDVSNEGGVAAIVRAEGRGRRSGRRVSPCGYGLHLIARKTRDKVPRFWPDGVTIPGTPRRICHSMYATICKQSASNREAVLG